MPGERNVFHLRVPAFAVAVEQVLEPRLLGRPVVVAPATAQAPIFELSDEARCAGIRRGMPASQALRICRDLLVLEPHPELYARAARAIEQLLDSFSPLVEPQSGGRAFVDATGTARLFGLPRDLGRRIAREVGQRLRLTARLGIATNKLCSGFAAQLVPPREALLEVPPGDEQGFLAPHSVRRLPGIDRATALLLEELALRRIGEVAVIPTEDLTLVLGPHGRTIAERARGIDPSPVCPPQREPELREVLLLPEETEDPRLLALRLGEAAARLGRQLRASRRVAARLRLTLRYADARGAAGSRRLEPPADLDLTLHRNARDLLDRLFTRRVRIRSLTLVLDHLVAAPRQLRLFDDLEPAEDAGPAPLGHFARGPREAALVAALDRIRGRFGEPAVRFGVPAPRNCTEKPRPPR